MASLSVLLLQCFNASFQQALSCSLLTQAHVIKFVDIVAVKVMLAKLKQILTLALSAFMFGFQMSLT
eukprot:3285310-Amphidinium_carterae.2